MGLTGAFLSTLSLIQVVSQITGRDTETGDAERLVGSLPNLPADGYRGRIQRKTWCIGTMPAVLRIRIRDPVTFWPLDPGSGIGFFRISDPGSQTHIFDSLVTIFLGKKFYNSLKIGLNFFLQHFKTKIFFFNFVKFVST